MKALGKVYWVLVIIGGIAMCLVIARELVRSGAMSEVLSAWPVVLVGLVMVGLVMLYFTRRGGSVNPLEIELAFPIAFVVALVVVAVVLLLLGFLGLWSGT